MLFDQYGHLDFNELILPLEQFHPFPKAGERDGWGVVTPETKAGWLAVAEQYKSYAWPTITADIYLLYNRTGENVPFLKRFFERRSVLGIFVLSECLEGEGRYLDQIINGIYCICEETSWITPFDLSLQKKVLPAASDHLVDLSCSETGALLAWTYYLLKEQMDSVSPRICERIQKEIRERLLVPYLARDDYWWMGFVETPRVNNWNPWCNRNILMCFLVLEEDTAVRHAGLAKIMKSLDVYLTKYLPDGCCDEGPMYWGAAGGGLHTCLALLQEASSGKIDIFEESIVREIGRYICKVHVHDHYFVDFADGDAIVKISPSVYYYGLALKDESMIALGANAPVRMPDTFNWFGIYEYMLDMLNEKERKKAVKPIPYFRDAWMWYAQVMTAREHQGSEKGFFVAAKGGHNAEAHNHNDVGNFVVYVDGRPLFIDLGTEEYTAKTFGPQRYELWYIQSQYHNCPTVHGVLQSSGEQYRAKDAAYSSTDAFAELKMDIGEAYPVEAGIGSWFRTCRLTRGETASVEIIDAYSLKTDEADVSYNLMTPYEPVLTEDNRIMLEYACGSRVFVRYDTEHLKVNFERITLEESRLKHNWGDVMYRIVLAEKAPVQQGTRKITIER